MSSPFGFEPKTPTVSCVLCEAAFVLVSPSNPKMAALSFAFITFAMLASQSASSRQREDHLLMLQPQLAADEQLSKVKGFLELHLFMFAPISPRTFVGIAIGKMETKGLLFSVFFNAL